MNTYHGLNGAKRLLVTNKPYRALHPVVPISIINHRHISISTQPKAQKAATKSESPAPQSSHIPPSQAQPDSPPSTKPTTLKRPITRNHSPYSQIISSTLEQWSEEYKDPPNNLLRREHNAWRLQRSQLQNDRYRKIAAANQSTPSEGNSFSLFGGDTTSSLKNPRSQDRQNYDLYGETAKSQNIGSAHEPLTPGKQWENTIRKMDVNLHLSPRIGRTVNLTSGEGDVEKKLRMLSAMVVANKIPQTFNKQRFHERPGLKRKRLKKERWRKRFKDTFKQLCSRAKELSAQGW